jgi:hypothetical protein
LHWIFINKESPTADDVVDMMVQMVGKQAALDEKGERRLRWVFGKFIRKKN